ncbi:MAG: hypothetical protein Q4G43_01630 [Mobilicoccus sp.]|nr:hypothetical protein [Mobilicoccus sp.]
MIVQPSPEGGVFHLADTDAIAAAGRRLIDLAAEINAARSFDTMRAGTEVAAAERAVDAFYDAWGVGLDEWQRHVAHFGNQVEQAADLYRKQDDGADQSWRTLGSAQ